MLILNKLRIKIQVGWPLIELIDLNIKDMNYNSVNMCRLDVN